MAPPLMANEARARGPGKPGHRSHPRSIFEKPAYFIAITLFLIVSTLYIITSRSTRFRRFDGGGEDLEDELHGCPVCVHPDVSKYPLDRALSDKGSKVRLCTGSDVSPFVSGTFVTQPILAKDGVDIGNHLAQITIFEVEMRHVSKQDSSSGRKAPNRSSGHTSYLRLLTFVEDDASIKKTQWEGWGASEPSELYSRNEINLTCHFWPGHDKDIQVLPPAYSIPAAIEERYSFHVVFTCPLPPYPLPGLHARTKKDGRVYFVQYGQDFQVQLAAATEGAELRMNPIPICRSEHEPALLKLLPANVAPPLPAGRSGGAGGGGGVVGVPRNMGGGGVKKGVVKPMQVAVCLRPFHTRKLFTSETAFSDARLIEWVEAALMMGVDRVYVYDRYGAEKKALLREYIERGQVVHVPFPPWTEVFVRAGQYANKARVPYLFPEIYDQVLSYEHCMMQGRRFGDKWQFHIDSDEFLWYDPKRGALLKPMLAKIEANHTKTYGEPLKVIRMRRYNFFGVEAANRADPVLERLGWRCGQPMWHTEGWAGWHDKLAVNPQIIIPNTVTIHNTNVPETNFQQTAKGTFHVNHYTSTGIDLGHHPCRPWVKPLKDEGLFWVHAKIRKCKLLPCGRKIPVECWPFCRLPWPAAKEDHQGDPEPEVDLAVNETQYLGGGAGIKTEGGQPGMNKRAQDHLQYQNLQPESKSAVSDKEANTTLYDDMRSVDEPEKGGNGNGLWEGGGGKEGRAGGQDSSFESGDIGRLPQDFRVDAMGLVEEKGKVGGDERIGGEVVSNDTAGEKVGEILG